MYLVIWTQDKLSGYFCVCATKEEAEEVIRDVEVVAHDGTEFDIEFVPQWSVKVAKES